MSRTNKTRSASSHATSHARKATLARRSEKSASKSASPARPEESSAASASFGNVDFGPYMKKMKRDIQSRWTPPKGFKDHKVVTVFAIRRDGEIVNPEIIDSSGVASVDRSAMQALEKASPLDPLPHGSPPYVQIRYKFEWKVSKN